MRIGSVVPNLLQVSKVPLALLLTISIAPVATAQTHAKPASISSPVAVTSLTTDERKFAAPWWPTKGDAPASAFSGESACARCHGDIAALQHQTPMYHAATPGAQYVPPPSDAALKLQEGQYTESIEKDAAGIRYLVVSGANSNSLPVAWVFGNGEMGETYLLRKDKGYVESRPSYYTSSNGLDVTTGHSAAVPSELRATLGHELSFDTAQRCFGCHTTASTLSGGFAGESAIPGITCEGCHGPGAKHVAIESAGHPPGNATAITNPAKMSPADSVDFCGSCHRTFSDAAVFMPANLGAVSVRFQPYRLEKSRCWGATGDARITCVACHDPHRPLERNSAAYDPKCLACHGETTSGAVAVHCKVAKTNCVSCHMPKVEIPQTHAKFTDHYIRIIAKDSFASASAGAAR